MEDYGLKFLLLKKGESFFGDDGEYGYRNQDGTGYYSSPDGSYGYFNEDGTAHFSGQDSSWGYVNESGEVYYNGAYVGDHLDDNCDTFEEECDDYYEEDVDSVERTYNYREDNTSSMNQTKKSNKGARIAATILTGGVSEVGIAISKLFKKRKKTENEASNYKGYKGEKHYCLNCGEILDNQKGFNPSLPIFVCKKCGALMYGENLKYPDTIWFCDGCNGLLNNQKGFNPDKTSHKCTNCGFKNDITEDNIIEEQVLKPEYFIKKHGFKVEDLNLYLDVYVDLKRDKTFTIPTLDGDETYNIPDDAESGKEYVLHNKGLKNAHEVGDLFVKLIQKETRTNQPTCSNVNSVKKDSQDELEELIGLESVKLQIRRLKAVLLKNKGRSDDLNLHMCFYGNPGTGKTVVARLVAKILNEIGVLPTDKLIETDRSGLCGRYIGETGPQTHAKVQEAMGGVLFIDEAYTLSKSGEAANDYGKEAIAALLKDMEDYKGKFCVILAGYRNEMEDMISTNPGFDSRINRKIDFPDYSIDEMIEIAKFMLKKKDYQIETDALNKLKKVFEILSNKPKFANARTIRNVLDELIEIQSVRTLEDNDKFNDEERIIKISDIAEFVRSNL